MKLKMMTIPMIAAGGLATGLLLAPAASANIDPCASAVSSSRCLGPSGVDGFVVPGSTPGAGFGFGNGPYGPWGGPPALGR
jgi:hypothetical protein